MRHARLGRFLTNPGPARHYMQNQSLILGFSTVLILTPGVDTERFACAGQ
jgi:hypothetical protein